MANYRNNIESIMAITKALADENRLRTFLVLRHQELCVCQIIEFLKLAPSTVSKHMSILKQAGLVESRKEGRWIYYRHAAGNWEKHVERTINWLIHSLEGDQTLKNDDQNIKNILKQDPEELCKKQCQN